MNTLNNIATTTSYYYEREYDNIVVDKLCV
jgi:hypothetical protein